ncbi:MAG: DUF2066 domain-containing protein [Gammaproteobacteria bacterium]|nr:DUF2066 domain-containing protein [Gammaproteobacteria bacterium]MDH4254955.1 DUF2066 domain-containing protein [Gammaproteobacteria bacterium]MDH5308854.1 DUF2066 domain-containing protein [Gammaproteobacteria bacterium]
MPDLPRLITALLALLAFGLLGAGSVPSFAIEVENLYTVQVPLDRSDPDARETAYARALAEVLSRITGSEGASSSDGLLALFPNPARYVMQFRAGEDDSLVITLDGPAIEKLLRQAGHPVWGSDRPLTLVWLAVDWGMGDREIIGADSQRAVPGASRSIDRNRLLRERVQAAAARRGIPLIFPLLDTEDLGRVSFSDVWGGFDQALLEASQRYGTSSVLVGRVRPSEPYRDRWMYYFGGQQREWTGGPETAVNLLADSLAEQFAYAGNAPVETVLLTVSGVDSVDAFGNVQRYLDKQAAIQGYRIEAVAGQELRFEVQVQGGSDRLAAALEFSGLLERSDWLDARNLYEAPAARRGLEYVYRPYAAVPAPSADQEQPAESAVAPPELD